jgi:hypothetical protein
MRAHPRPIAVAAVVAVLIALAAAAVRFSDGRAPAVALPRAGAERTELEKPVEATDPAAVGRSVPTFADLPADTVFVWFYPNSWDPRKTLVRSADGKPVEEVYDPSFDQAVERAAYLVGQAGTARVVIEGHVEPSQQATGPANQAKYLARQRANAVKKELLARYPDLVPDRLVVLARGWERPADPKDPVRNRRVEVRVLPPKKS